MSTDYGTIGIDPPRRGRGAWIAALIAFLLGLAAMAWLLGHWQTARDWLLGAKTVQTATPQQAVQAPQPTPSPLTEEAVAAADPAVTAALGARVGELEVRIDRVGERANAAGANAARAEGLLIAFAARRAIDRGLGLGYIEGQLRERFGATQPQAVATIIAASHDPITLGDLQMGLDDLGPVLAGGAPDEGWWDAVRRELGSLIIVRKAGTPSPEPAERLRHAKRLLADGQVDRALVEVARLPGRDKAERWMAAARRYIAVRGALDVLETAAILQPKLATTPPPLLPEPPQPQAAPAQASQPAK